MKHQKGNKCGLYVHVPFCSKKCLYCGFYSEPVNRFDVGRTVTAILTELDGYGSFVPDTIYIGGGSPSCLPAEELMRLAAKVSGLNPAAEFTVEVNPSQVNIDMLAGLIESGVNRLSIGAQSMDDVELQMLGRNHKAEDVIKSVELARQAGFGNISLDLIFALPGSTLHKWLNTLNVALLLEVEHISAYSLMYEKGTPLFTAKESGHIDWVDEDTELRMYESCIDALQAAGYGQYEISNFARDGFRCEHNIGYWKCAEYIGIGPAAASYWQKKRTTNIADIKKYIEGIQAGQKVADECVPIGPEDAACEAMVLGLRMIDGVDLGEFEECTGYNAEKVFGEVIERHLQGGMLQKTAGRIRLTKRALAVADRVLCDFAGM